jgi:prepilin-type N-terminal cleavage/methylation domain-containing protein
MQLCIGIAPRTSDWLANSRLRRANVGLRLGLTAIELLIVVAIIGVLASLMLPAVQSARESSRRSTCSSNLRQIGVAIAGYESLHRMLPPGSSRGLSLFVNLLPHVEHNDLFSQIDFRDPRSAKILRSAVIFTYLCPSDGVPRLVATGDSSCAGTNYAACSGIWPNDYGFNGLFRSFGRVPPYDMGGPVTISQVTDGLSNTIAVGEILRANGRANRLRVVWELPRYYEPGELEAFATACQGLPQNPQGLGWLGDQFGRGLPWHDGSSFANTFYNHVLTPGHPTCLNQNNVISAASTTSSSHAGGVDSLFGDGHVVFTSDNIDTTVWRSLGGRNDGR